MITGLLRVPDKGFGKDVKIRMHPDKHLNENEHYRSSEQAKGVGHLDARRGQFEAIVWFPESNLTPICTSLAARKQRYVTMSTSDLVRKEGSITWFSLCASVDERSWLDYESGWKTQGRKLGGGARRK